MSRNYLDSHQFDVDAARAMERLDTTQPVKRRRGRPPKSAYADPTPRPDAREPWQIAQAARCGCRGSDDLCPCQNENPWPRPRRDYEAEVRTLELQQQTDRQTITILLRRIAELEAALNSPEPSAAGEP